MVRALLLSYLRLQLAAQRTKRNQRSPRAPKRKKEAKMKMSKSSTPVSGFVKTMVVVAFIGLLVVSAVPNLLWGASSSYAQFLIAGTQHHWALGSTQTLASLSWAWMTIFASSTLAALAFAFPLHRFSLRAS
jgi:hypothetical protein